MNNFQNSYLEQKEELKKNSDLIRNHTSEKHKEEEEKAIQYFEETYPQQPKFSSDVLNMQKKMEEHVKKKEYEKANDLKINIIRLCSEQTNKWKTEIHDKKLTAELEKLHLRQKNELSKLELKIKLSSDEFEKNIEIQRQIKIKNYKNKIKDMINDHITSKNSFNKPSKYSLIKKIGNNTFSS